MDITHFHSCGFSEHTIAGPGCRYTALLEKPLEDFFARHACSMPRERLDGTFRGVALIHHSVTVLLLHLLSGAARGRAVTSGKPPPLTDARRSGMCCFTPRHIHPPFCLLPTTDFPTSFLESGGGGEDGRAFLEASRVCIFKAAQQSCSVIITIRG